MSLLRQAPTIRRVCVARFGAIGDLLMTTPTLRALQRIAPGVEIDYIVGRGLGDVLSGLPTLRRIIEFDKKSDVKPARMLAVAATLRRERYDLFINLQRSVKTVLLAIGSRAPHVLTYERRRAPLPGGTLQHTVDNFLDTLRPLGVDPARADRHLDFFIPDAARERVKVLLGEDGIGLREPLVVLNPGVSDLVRRWPIGHIAAFFDEMAAHRPDVRLALCGAPGGDVETARAILAQTRSADAVANLAGRTSFKETGALLARASVLVTGDTGPMHLAAAIGTPLVALFGPTDPHRTGPMSPPGRALVLVQNEGLPCVPCRSRECARGDNACMVRQVPSQVVAAVERHLRAAAGTGAAA